MIYIHKFIMIMNLSKVSQCPTVQQYEIITRSVASKSYNSQISVTLLLTLSGTCFPQL